MIKLSGSWIGLAPGIADTGDNIIFYKKLIYFLDNIDFADNF